MTDVLVWFLRNRVYLGRAVVLSAIIPFLIASIPLLTTPMLIAAIALFVTLNWWRLKALVSNFLNAHFWLKIQYFWFVTGAVVLFLMLETFLRAIIIPHYIVGLLYLAIYIIWFNKIDGKFTESDHRVILKGETTETSSSLDFEPYLVPLILTLMVVFLISSLQSMVLTRGAAIFTIETIHWYFPLVVLLVHFVINILFVDQIEWYPKDGSTSWKPRSIDLEFPDVTDPLALSHYFEEVGKLLSPPPSLDAYIEKNLEFLVSNAQNLVYFPSHLQFVRAMENWGREARDLVHMMMAIVLASVSQYRFIGLIPLYKRKMFYQGLEVIAMTGSMTTRWRELIEFEVLEKKDEHFVLDWVLGSRYLEFKYHPAWIVAWEGTIYKGKAGYYEAVRKMDLLLQIRPEMEQWELDLWDLCYEYSKIFIGEKSRQLFSENMHYYDQLLFLAGKQTKQDYITAKEKYQQELLNPSERLVSIPEYKPERTYNQEEKTEIIDSLLFNQDQTTSVPSLSKALGTWFSEIPNRIRNLRAVTLVKIVGILVVFGLNLGLAYMMDTMVVDGGGFLFITIEVVLLFVFSITPSSSDLNLGDEMQTQSEVLQTSAFSQAAVNIATAEINTGTVYLLYALTLLFVYRLWLF